MIASWLLFLDSVQRKRSIKTDNVTFIGLSTLQPLQYVVCSIKPIVILAALCLIHSSLSVSIWGHLSKTGRNTTAMFSQEVGRGELSLPQPVGYSLAVNTAQYVFGFFITRASLVSCSTCVPHNLPLSLTLSQSFSTKLLTNHSNTYPAVFYREFAS